MTMKTVAAVALVCGLSTTGVMAGDVSPAGTADQDIVMLPDMATGSSAGSSGGSLAGGGGVLVPALAGLLIVGALAAGGGS